MDRILPKQTFFTPSPSSLLPHIVYPPQEGFRVSLISKKTIELKGFVQQANCIAFQNVKADDINVGGEKDASILSFLKSLGFDQKVNMPTHDEGNTIDVVFVNSYLSDKVTVMQKSYGFTDHDLLLVNINSS